METDFSNKQKIGYQINDQLFWDALSAGTYKLFSNAQPSLPL